ncbi:MAG: hypothetical protein V9G19_06330 [Tetrasphaera sp.]
MRAFAGALPLADRDGGGFGSLPVLISPATATVGYPDGAAARADEQVVALGRGWVARLVHPSVEATPTGLAPPGAITVDGAPVTMEQGVVLGTAGVRVEYPDITHTQSFPFTVDGQRVTVTVSTGV